MSTKASNDTEMKQIEVNPGYTYTISMPCLFPENAGSDIFIKHKAPSNRAHQDVLPKMKLIRRVLIKARKRTTNKKTLNQCIIVILLAHRRRDAVPEHSCLLVADDFLGTF